MEKIQRSWIMERLVQRIKFYLRMMMLIFNGLGNSIIQFTLC